MNEVCMLHVKRNALAIYWKDVHDVLEIYVTYIKNVQVT